MSVLFCCLLWAQEGNTALWMALRAKDTAIAVYLLALAMGRLDKAVVVSMLTAPCHEKSSTPLHEIMAGTLPEVLDLLCQCPETQATTVALVRSAVVRAACESMCLRTFALAASSTDCARGLRRVRH